MTIFPSRRSGTLPTKSGARTWSRTERIGGPRSIRRQHDAPTAHLRWLPFGRLQHSDQTSVGVETSAVSAAMVRGARM